ncbi:hypothetical protein TNCT_653451 [Trichonephila clavata]|uniref:Uncharacterized protein n=1 Tax=Trichonephila clavata TaxID=2740835 RepID=A0A8X6FCK2_TRICU|nr:hypothetical protein TNCT_653451 [Trichonephila clavata]
MSRYMISQLSSYILKAGTTSKIFYASCSSKNSSGFQIENVGNYQQAAYYTAKDVEFCPNRAKEIMQNNVEETSEKAVRNDSSVPEEKTDSSTLDDEHMKAYQADSSTVRALKRKFCFRNPYPVDFHLVVNVMCSNGIFPIYILETRMC